MSHQFNANDYSGYNSSAGGIVFRLLEAVLEGDIISARGAIEVLGREAGLNWDWVADRDMPAGSTLKLSGPGLLTAEEGPQGTARLTSARVEVTAPEAEALVGMAASAAALRAGAAPAAQPRPETAPATDAPVAQAEGPEAFAPQGPAFDAAPEFSDEDEDFVAGGVIDGTLSMQGGDDRLTLEGTVLGSAGTAVDMGEGDDSVTLGEDAQIYGDILLGEGDDHFDGAAAAEELRVYGGAGDDEILGGAGDDALYGGSEDDALYGGAGDDLLDGGSGDDFLNGGAGDDLLSGGAGDDELLGEAGNDTLSGGDGDDRLSGGAGQDQLFGGAGDDNLSGGAGNDLLDGGAGNDTASYAGETAALNVNLATGLATGAGNDRLTGIENVIGGAGNDVLAGDAAANILNGGAGNDDITVAGGDTAIGGAGNDRIVALTQDSGAITVEGGAGFDLLQLAGNGSGTLRSTAGVEHIEAMRGEWAVNVHSDVEFVHVYENATLTSGVRLDNDDKVAVFQGFGGARSGMIRAGQDALHWQGGGAASVANYGEISVLAGNRLLQTAEGATGALTLTNMMGASLSGALKPSGAGAADALITLNNQGAISADGRVMDFEDFSSHGARFVLNNAATGVITQTGEGADLIRAGAGGVINNHGTITAAAGVVDAGDAIDFRADAGGVVNNFAGGLIEGAKHAVTGDMGLVVVNAGTMIGRNGSAVNIDNGAPGAGVVTVTNAAGGVMQGRSADLADSDGDAIDVDGELSLDNAGLIQGMGASGAKDGEANVSEAIAMGGGRIVNQQGGQILGHGRAIQVDNSGNGPALSATVITNHGLIRGEGNGPVNATAAQSAGINLTGNEAINLIGTQDDVITNSASGEIRGGISMGAGNDLLENHGVITATGGAAVDMGEGDDTFLLQAGSVAGLIRLGAGNDRFEAAAGITGALQIDAGAGDDILRGGAGDDQIVAGAGDDLIYASAGRDVIDGGAGFDVLDLSALQNPVTVDMRAGWLRGADNVTTSFRNIEELAFGEGDNNVTGGAGDDRFDGGAGDDILSGGAGNDHLEGGLGDDRLEGGSGADYLSGGAGDDLLNGGSGDDVILGGAGHDVIRAGSGDDRIEGAAGNDLLSGGSGADTFVFAPGFGRDTLSDFARGDGDVLEFSSDLFADYAALRAAAEQSGSDVVITFDDANSLTLEHTTLSQLAQDDFRFV